MSENNRYFLASQPLIAPEDGYKIEPHLPIFGYQRKKSYEQTSKISKLPLLKLLQVDLMGKRTFAYHIMALQVRKEHGNIKDAFLNRLVGDYEDKYNPFIIDSPLPEDGSDPEEDYICLEKKSAENPLGLKNVPTYDPKREGSIGEQLSAGRAQGEGDVFEWRTTLSF